MLRVAVVGLGKMGISHLAMMRPHPDVSLDAVCDSARFIPDVLGRYTGLVTYSDFEKMLAEVELDAVVIATPTKSHSQLVRTALNAGLHVFCEKPLCLDPEDSQALAELAEAKGLVAQVGYHNRFVAAFQEVRSLLDQNAIGDVTHAFAEAYGPVVLRSKGGTWRAERSEGGSCLYDYAAHPLDLLTWYLGEPTKVGGSSLGHIFSSATDDEVYASLFYENNVTSQISVNWSDESQRKMSTKITLWGTTGRITADRQECRVYLRDTAEIPDDYGVGWNVRYTTDLTPPVWFYLRGEEYSAQLDHFVKQAVIATQGENSFASAASTDRTMYALAADSATRNTTPVGVSTVVESARPSSRWADWWRRVLRRGQPDTGRKS